MKPLIVAVVLAVASQVGYGAEGEQLFQRCAVCHLQDGAGIPGVFPPLRNRFAKLFDDGEGRAYLVMAISSGLIGTITVDGAPYSGVMPAQTLADSEVAAVLNYILSSLHEVAKDTKPFTTEEVVEIRADFPQVTGQQVVSMRPRLLEGANK